MSQMWEVLSQMKFTYLIVYSTWASKIFFLLLIFEFCIILNAKINCLNFCHPYSSKWKNSFYKITPIPVSANLPVNTSFILQHHNIKFDSIVNYKECILSGQDISPVSPDTASGASAKLKIKHPPRLNSKNCPRG